MAEKDLKRQTSMEESGGNTSNKCGTCRKIVAKKAEALQCEYCSTWFHIGCQSIPSDVYRVMKQASGELFHWFCNGCNNKAIDVLKLVQTIKEKNDELDGRMSSVEAKVHALDSQFEERVSSSVKKVVREEVFEARMREERRLNIVVKNLPEERPDDEAWLELVQAMGVPGIGEVNGCSRIGKAGAEGKPRPLKVECASSSQKQKLLRNSNKLARAAEGKFKNVFLNRDLTRTEQNEQRQLREELKKMKEENPAKRFVIRRNAVVELTEQDEARGGGGAGNSSHDLKNGH